jgi:hypothetical protein
LHEKIASSSFPLCLHLGFTSQPRGFQPLTIIIEVRRTGSLFCHGCSGVGSFRDSIDEAKAGSMKPEYVALVPIAAGFLRWNATDLDLQWL